MNNLTNKNGIEYILKKRQNENDDYFNDKCWTLIHQNPITKQEFNHSEKISILLQNKKYYNCEYSDDIEKIIKLSHKTKTHNT